MFARRAIDAEVRGAWVIVIAKCPNRFASAGKTGRLVATGRFVVAGQSVPGWGPAICIQVGDAGEALGVGSNLWCCPLLDALSVYDARCRLLEILTLTGGCIALIDGAVQFVCAGDSLPQAGSIDAGVVFRTEIVVAAFGTFWGRGSGGWMGRIADLAG